MTNLVISRITAIWLLMIGATLLSWQMGHGAEIIKQRYVAAAIIVITFVKVRLLIFEFMEIKTAPFWMRFAFDLWMMSTSGVIIFVFLWVPM